MRRAYTLVEMLISIALGSMIALVAWAQVRSAAQAAAIGNRMSIENGLMRAGFRAALDELDSWKQYDDPSATPPHAPLASVGRPFAPLTFRALSSDDPAPADSDFDLDLDQSRAKTWWRGTSIDWHARHGNFGLHTSLTDADAERRWYARMLDTLAHSLGYYGMLEYMPAGTLFSYYTDQDGRTAEEFFNCWYTPPAEGFLYNQDIGTGWENVPRDIYPLSSGSAYAITTNPDYLGGAHGDANRHLFAQWNNVDPQLPSRFPQWAMPGLMACAEDVPALTMKPGHWPSLGIAVRRFVMSARFWAKAEIRVVSPVSGQVFRLHFSTHTTTLRGARRQRGLDRMP